MSPGAAQGEGGQRHETGWCSARPCAPNEMLVMQGAALVGLEPGRFYAGRCARTANE